MRSPDEVKSVGLKTLLSSIIGAERASQPAGRGTTNGRTPATRPVETPAMREFAAVSIAPGKRCCVAARSASEQRTLVREVGKLPLPDCTMPDECSCRFAKYADRRDGEDRRLFGWDGTSTWHQDGNRRLSRGRRDEDI